MNSTSTDSVTAGEVLNVMGRQATKQFRKQAARAQRDATRTQRSLDRTSWFRIIRRARLAGRLKRHQAVIEMAGGIGNTFTDQTTTMRYSTRGANNGKIRTTTTGTKARR